MSDNGAYDEDRMALKLSTLLSSIDPDDTDRLEAAISSFNDNELDQRKSTVSQNTAREIYLKMQEYHSMTDLIGQMNEAENANRYADDMINREAKRLARIDMEARKELHKTQQKYLLIAYRRRHMRFITNVMLFTIAFVSVIANQVALYMQEYFSLGFFGASLVILGVCYTAALVAAFSYESNRRRYHWKQFYWNVTDMMKKAMDKNNDVAEVGTCK